MSINRRGFLTSALAAAGFATLTACPIPKIATAPVQMIQQSPKAEYDRCLEEVVNEVIPGMIISEYEYQLKGDPNKKLESEAYEARLNNLDQILNMGFSSGNSRATENLLKQGIAYSRFDSFIGTGNYSYIFGKIASDELLINDDFGNNESCRVVKYSPFEHPVNTTTFEDYSSNLNLFGIRLLGDFDVIFINEAEIKRYSDFIYNHGMLLAIDKASPKSFYDQMLIKEVQGSGSKEAIARNLTEAMIHHEMNQPKESKESARGDMTAKIAQMYYQPFLTLADLDESSRNDSRQDQINKQSADMIFHAFENYKNKDGVAYTREKLMNSSKEEIRKVITQIFNF
jgi:hypothetical protein